MTITKPELADRLLAAFNAATIDESLFTDDALAWHNFDQVDRTMADGFALLSAIKAAVPDFRLEASSFHTKGEVTVMQYTVRGTTPDGSTVAAPSCLIVHTDGDRVSRVEEYLDSAQLAPILALLA